MDSKTIFLDKVKEYDVLSHHEQMEYIERAQQGDNEARETLINHNLKLIVSLANKYQNNGIDLMDLIQAGYFGMDKAIDKFEIGRGLRFSTYVHYWVLQTIRREITDFSRTIRIPSYISDLLPKIHRARDVLETNNEKVTADKLAEMLNVKKGNINKALDSESQMLSLEYENESEDTLQNIIEQNVYDDPEEILRSREYYKERTKDIYDALNTLNELHKSILILRFGLDDQDNKRTLQEVAEIVGITKERVRQIEKTSLNILRNQSGRSDRRKKIQKYIAN